MTLQFSRQPFLSQTTSVMVPWNQVITMGTVLMVLSDNDLIPPNPAFCGVVHEHYTLQPVVLSTWQHTQLGSCPEKSTIIPESQVLITSIQWINSFLLRDEFYSLLINFANSFDPDQDGQNICSDLEIIF